MWYRASSNLYCTDCTVTQNSSLLPTLVLCLGGIPSALLFNIPQGRVQLVLEVEGWALKDEGPFCERQCSAAARRWLWTLGSVFGSLAFYPCDFDITSLSFPICKMEMMMMMVIIIPIWQWPYETDICEVVTVVPAVAVDVVGTEVLHKCWLSFGIEELFLHLKKIVAQNIWKNIKFIGVTF